MLKGVSKALRFGETRKVKDLEAAVVFVNELEPDIERLSDADLAKRTLTNLYNARPTWLAQAHERLDAVVLAAYGWPADVDREDLLARLLSLNLAQAEVHGGLGQ